MMKFYWVLIISMLLQSCSIHQKPDNSPNRRLIEEGYIKLIVKRMNSGHLHIYGKLNGVDGNFILDTGSGATIIDKRNKEKFHLKSSISDMEGTGAGGAGMSIQQSINNNLNIDGYKLLNLNLLLMDLNHVNQAFEAMGLELIDGVLGADILASKKAVIDYANLALYLKI